MNHRIKILLVCGTGRSGSTLLDTIIGQVDGFFSAGEIRLWPRKYLGITGKHAEVSLCGCGKPIKLCKMWSEILNRTFPGLEHADPRHILGMFNNGPSRVHIPLMVLPGGKSAVKSRLQNWLHNQERLYGQIQDIAKCKVIVDSSKFPPYGYAVQMIQSIDLHIVHLVRDPRAIAFSWQRQRYRMDGRHHPLFNHLESSPFRVSLYWNTANLLTELFWKRSDMRYKIIRYEDFMRQPRETVESILLFMGERTQNLPFDGEQCVRLRPTHTVSGNPCRFKTGSTCLRIDDEWIEQMKLRDKMIVTALTWPLLHRYRYAS